jgi:adenosyl cobinamide kinase/adenosyl cobinamide phosphate guanylyltransferase
LRTIRNALWSNIPAIAESAAIVLVQCNQTWVKEAIEESCIDERLKEELLSKTQIWK